MCGKNVSFYMNKKKNLKNIQKKILDVHFSKKAKAD